MKKASFIIISLIVLSVITPFCFAQSGDPYVIFDDWFSTGWSNTWSWGVSNDIDNALYGYTCLDLDIPASAQYQNIEYTLADTLNMSLYNDFIMWFHGDGSGETLQIRFENNASSFYYATFTISYTGWDYIAFIDYAGFVPNGTPDWDLISKIMIMVSSNNANAIDCKFDYMFLTNEGFSVPTPTPDPEPELYQTFELILFGEYAFVGLLVFMILGAVAITLNKYLGVFVFILTMVYEIILFDNMTEFGLNVYYMIGLLVYAIFCALWIFWGNK